LNIASKYGLKRRFHAAGVWVFCVPEGKRAEQFFTPYGKAQVQSFGSEPLVEVAYGIFYDGSFGYLDDFIVEFDSLVTRSAIDSINSLYHVVIDTTFVIAERLWYVLLVTKQSPYSSFDMSNFYHCLPEVRDRTAHANVSGFNPPLGAKCVRPSSAGKSVITNSKISRFSP
jgi:hypothetical protein